VGWWLVALWLGCGGPTNEPEALAPIPPERPVVPAPVDPSRPDLPEPLEARYGASHILISWEGAPRSTATRSEVEAAALARDLHQQVLDGADLAELARTHSDGPSGPRGGSLGVYATGTMVPSFERATASVDVGEIAPLVKSPFGWHIIRRDAVREAHAAHVLVSWEGAWRSKQTRTKAEARARAEKALSDLQGGSSFADVARAMSDDTRTADKGGDLGVVAPGQFLPPFEEALFALEPGTTSGIVETDYGFHIVQRLAE